MPEAPGAEPAKLGKPLNVLYLNAIAAQQNRWKKVARTEVGRRDGNELAWLLLLGFGCAYFMSFGFRVVNSIIGPDLARELDFSGGSLVVAHLLALHDVGSNNPDGIEIKANKGPDGIPLDGIPFHPYYTVHDIFMVSVFLMVFSAIVFFAPEVGGYFLEYNNFIPADPFQTPLHIAPVWYFTPFYSMLRAVTGEMMYVFIACVVAGAAFGVIKGKLSALMKGVIVVGAAAVVAMMLAIDAKFWGVVAMGGGVVILFFLPWLDNSPVKSIRYRPSWHKVMLAIFVVNFVVLGYLGILPPSVIGGRVAQLGTLFYFGFFLLMPWWSTIGEPKPVPDRVTFTAH